MVSKGNKDYLESWNRAHSFYVLINNLFTCFLRPETLQETEFKGDRLIWRKKKTSRQHIFRLWHGYWWLL